MQNLYEDVVVNQTADLIIHAGDHCCEHTGKLLLLIIPKRAPDGLLGVQTTRATRTRSGE